ncbi:RING/U-box superfamily protein [Euphorbia peplus]|nr:RING/U-box superfamily protein [Euphorbia peplus]
MSFAGAPAADQSGAAKMFFCYQCNRTVTIIVSSAASDPSCPHCNEGFLEEYENPSPNPSFNFQTPNHNSISDPFFAFPDPISSLLPHLFSSSTTIDFQNPNFFETSRSGSASDPDAFNPMVFLRNHIQNLQSNGARIQLVIDNNSGVSDPGGIRMPPNIGDYFFGPGLEQLIQQLAENDPNRYGTPPASKSAIDGLPTIKITKELLNSEMNQCAVCKDEFEDGAEAKQMPWKSRD